MTKDAELSSAVQGTQTAQGRQGLSYCWDLQTESDVFDMYMIIDLEIAHCQLLSLFSKHVV